MARDFEDYTRGTFNDDLAELDEAYDRGMAERRRAKKVVDEELSDSIEYRDWFIYEKEN